MKKANREVKCEIKKDKLSHKKRAEAQLSTGRIRSSWGGFKSMAGLMDSDGICRTQYEKWTDNS